MLYIMFTLINLTHIDLQINIQHNVDWFLSIMWIKVKNIKYTSIVIVSSNSFK